jgi:hypothetical protein
MGKYNHNEEQDKPDHHEYEKTSRKGRLNHKWRDKKRQAIKDDDDEFDTKDTDEQYE